MSSAPIVHGTTAPGFEPVREAFAGNLRRRRELGAACALVRRGEVVVDLWGGPRERGGPPWKRDTRVLTYSVSKGVAAAALALLNARGLLDYDARVADYWPEFAQAGKDAITVRTLLAHQAGLAALDLRLTPAIIADTEALDELLARQAPGWPPGARHAYHAISLGFYQDALLRRVDPAGRGMAAFVREELGAPLEDGLWIGVPPEADPERVARIEPLQAWRLFLHPKQISPRFGLALAWPWSESARSIRNPRLEGPASLDEARWRSRSLPASNVYATARALARLYEGFSAGHAPWQVPESTRSLLQAAPSIPPAGPWDAVFKRRTAFLLGFMKPSADFAFGRSPAAFGAPGLGGSFAYADPDREAGYAYLTNRLGFRVFDDARERALRAACEACLDATG